MDFVEHREYDKPVERFPELAPLPKSGTVKIPTPFKVEKPLWLIGSWNPYSPANTVSSTTFRWFNPPKQNTYY